MTYTFKLARRLAVSRRFGMLSALLFVAACAGENAMAPEGSSSNSATPTSLQVYPQSIVVQTNQPVKFHGKILTLDGTSIVAPIAWASTGGVMNPDGTFTSSKAGTFKIVGRGRGWKNSDTSTVTVVPPSTDLTGITVSPETASLQVRATHAFSAAGLLADGTTKPVGVNWTATGGTVDPAGTYTAGDVAGTYRIVAQTVDGAHADTASVTVTAPTLSKVMLIPASFSLTTGGTKQLTTYGVNSVGDTIAPSVTFSATGGTVNSSGLFTAGSTAGTYRVVAKSGTLADTAAVTLNAPTTSPPPTATGVGVPFGPFHLPNDQYGVRTWYNGALRALTTSSASSDLSYAKSKGIRIAVSLPGSRAGYTNSDKTFSLSRWKQNMDAWRSQAALLQTYYANGTILANYLVDEPDCSSCWGGKTITGAQVAEMSSYAKSIIPGIPTVVRVVPAWFRRVGLTGSDVDLAWAQYGGPLHPPSLNMSPEQFRDQNVADAKALGMGLILGMNTLDGGDGSSRIPGTFNLTTVSNRWQMSAAEVQHAGTVFAKETYVCAVLDWRYSPTLTSSTFTSSQADGVQAFDNRSDVKAALAQVLTAAKSRAVTPCK
jgi:hypothetical protein